MHYLQEIKEFVPTCEQEAGDRRLMLEYLAQHGDAALTRDCELGHFTASSMIFNSARDKVLMIYHNIYNSWSWTGGHADGEVDLLQVAMREAREETGIHTLQPLIGDLFALDILTVCEHVKRGNYVSAHLHFNLSYLLEADETEALQMKEDENSGVRWIPVSQIKEFVTEPEMMPVYEKLIRGGQR